ncbi:YicC family protein [Alcaligenaceae bacterium CGII-47]|nr:YicC family protein [Alcaligenaceae bacterium CGII-47]
MIRSMTAFGAARIDTELGTLNIDLRSVNNRYLDLSLRLPEDLRFAESRIRELLTSHLARGKVELRVSYSLRRAPWAQALNVEAVQQYAQYLRHAREHIPDIPAPSLSEFLSNEGEHSNLDPDQWLPLCEQACSQALSELQAARSREGRRLADAMLLNAQDIAQIIDLLEPQLPTLIREQETKISLRLRDALLAASPEGFAQISGAELSARIAQEAALFGLRIDVAEELTRLRSHLDELNHILQDDTTKVKGSLGKRLDFLFQEMNREANTLGSKAAALAVTQAAITLKLLIEQMREQAQNIE